MRILEQELEPETVSVLDEIRRTAPGKQREVALGLPAKLITGVYLNRLKLAMVPFGCHLKFAPTLGALFCRYEGEDLAEQIGIQFEHWKALGLDSKVMQGMVRTYYEELRAKCGAGKEKEQRGNGKGQGREERMKAEG